MTAPPLLRWRPFRGATYYNVQLYRVGQKVLSRWPTRTRLQLTRTWSFRGTRYRLRPGTYSWFVWPGYGKPAAARYGKILLRGRFVVVR